MRKATKPLISSFLLSSFRRWLLASYSERIRLYVSKELRRLLIKVLGPAAAYVDVSGVDFCVRLADEISLSTNRLKRETLRIH